MYHIYMALYIVYIDCISVIVIHVYQEECLYLVESVEFAHHLLDGVHNLLLW